MNIRNKIFILLSACTLTACARSGPGTASTPVNALAGTRWALTSYGADGSETQVPADPPATLEFDEQNRVSGSGGCNTFGGDYQVYGEKIGFTNITSTLMACDETAVMQQEMDYLQALARAERYEIVDDEMTIWYDNGAHVLNFARRWEQTDFPGNHIGNHY